MKFYKNVIIIVLSLIFSVVDSCAGRLIAFDSYLTQIEDLSGQRILYKEQMKKDYESKKYGNRILSEEEKAQKHDDFNAKKDKLIKEWEQNTNSSWPKYDEKTECTIDSTCISKKTGWRYDVHHIVPQSYDGPNEWWNLIPLDIRQHNLIHGTPIVVNFSVPFPTITYRKLSDSNIIDDVITVRRHFDKAFCCNVFPNSCIVKEFGIFRGEY